MFPLFSTTGASSLELDIEEGTTAGQFESILVSRFPGPLNLTFNSFLTTDLVDILPTCILAINEEYANQVCFRHVYTMLTLEHRTKRGR